MPLQLRRGTTAERLSIVPLPGEPIYDTDLDTIFIGNGIAAGGISAITGITSEDAQDIVGQMFTNGQHDNVVFTYGSTQDAAGRIDARLDLSIYDGEISASGFRGSLFADDSGLIIDSSTKNISANDISANTITVQTLSVDTLNLTNFAVADIKGSLFADDSTLLVDAVTGTIPYAVLSGAPTALSNFTNDLGFISVADISDGTVTIDVNNTGDLQGSVFADNSTILVDATNSAINLDGTVKGDIIPDANEAYDLGSNANRFKDLYLSGTSLFLGSAQITAVGSAVNLPAGSTVDGVSIGTGSGTGDGVVAGSNYNINIVGDDSTLIVDSDLKIFTGSLIGNVTGNLLGDVTGNVTGNLLGDVTGNVTGNLLGDVTGNVTGNLLGNVTGNVTGNLLGNVTGNVTGDVKGSVFADDSSLLVDAVDRVFIGNLAGNIATSVITSLDSSAINIIPPVVMNTDLFVDSDVFADNFVGNITTNFISSADSSEIIFEVPASFSSRITVDDDITVNNGGTLLLNSNESTSNLQIATHSDSDLPGIILMRRSRGTAASPAALQANDRIHQLNFNAFDGNNYLNAASIQAQVTGTVSTGVIPSSLRFFVTGVSGTLSRVGEINQNGSLNMFAGSAAATPIIVSTFHNNGSDASNINLLRARGTEESPLILQNGDPIIDIRMRGYDGAGYNGGVTLRASVNGAVSSGIVPAKLDVYLTTDVSPGSFTIILSLEQTKVTFAAPPVIPTYADETAADTAIGGSGNRVNGMMYYDTALGKNRAVAGGSWVDLH